VEELAAETSSTCFFCSKEREHNWKQGDIQKNRLEKLAGRRFFLTLLPTVKPAAVAPRAVESRQYKLEDRTAFESEVRRMGAEGSITESFSLWQEHVLIKKDREPGRKHSAQINQTVNFFPERDAY